MNIEVKPKWKNCMELIERVRLENKILKNEARMIKEILTDDYKPDSIQVKEKI